jgi:Fe-S-cluster containining protein
VFEALEAIYRDLDREIEGLGVECAACGECCHLDAYGHELWLTDLELAYLAHRCGLRAPTVPGVCPYLEQGRCAARAGRSLSCRIFHCELDSAEQERLHEAYLQQVRRLDRDRCPEIGFGELLASLAAAAGDQAGTIPRTNE